MGFHVGIPTLKLANKVGGNASRKRTGTLRAVACEALEERWSRDPDIDHSLTRFNWYEGIRSGVELTERMTQEAEDYSQKRKEAGGRALRSTASIGFVTIVKPDMDVINGLTPEQRERFFKDSNEILDSILGEDNVRSRVIHRDELGEHEHVFRMGFTQNGELSVDSLVNPRIWRKVNLEYPEKMREKGWNGVEKDGVTLPCVDDCEMYDAEKAEVDPDYARRRKARKRAAGRSSSKYKADRDAARVAALDTRQAELDALQTALDSQVQAVQVAQAANRREAARLAAWRKSQEETGRQLAAQLSQIQQDVQTVQEIRAAIPQLVQEAMRRELEAARVARPPRRPSAQKAAQDVIQKALEAARNVRQPGQHNGPGYSL